MKSRTWIESWCRSEWTNFSFELGLNTGISLPYLWYKFFLSSFKEGGKEKDCNNYKGCSFYDSFFGLSSTNCCWALWKGIILIFWKVQHYQQENTDFSIMSFIWWNSDIMCLLESLKPIEKLSCWKKTCQSSVSPIIVCQAFFNCRILSIFRSWYSIRK